MEILESLLKERLVIKYGDMCSKCKQKDDLVIGHIDGQAYLELAYFKTPESMWDYYHKNFDRESAFIMLVCKKCMEAIPSPQHPTFQDMNIIVNEFLHENLQEEMQKLIEKYPHITQTTLRAIDKVHSILKEDVVRRELNAKEFGTKE